MRWGFTGSAIVLNVVHALRHTFASLLLSQGTPITEVSSYLGHADPQITLKGLFALDTENEDRFNLATSGHDTGRESG